MYTGSRPCTWASPSAVCRAPYWSRISVSLSMETKWDMALRFRRYRVGMVLSACLTAALSNAPPTLTTFAVACFK